MSLLHRKPKGPTETELQLAYDWNRWADAQSEMWRAIEAAPRDQFVRRALHLNDAMWQLDPGMWEAVTASWPTARRRRRP